MKCSELIKQLCSQSPEEYACEWDNVGLLVGDRQQEIKTVYIDLDATDEVIDAAVTAGADLLLTHHPMIFKGMMQVNEDNFTGRRIRKLIKNGICLYAMHTNFDIEGMAELAAAKIGLSHTRVLDSMFEKEGKEYGIGRVGTLLRMTLGQCAAFVKEAFSLSQVQVFGDLEKTVNVAAISPGSGKSEIKNAIAAGADVLITGDIDHHDGLDAWAQGLAVIDAGHYGLEQIFIPYMQKYLEQKCPGLSVCAGKQKLPYRIV